MSTEEEVAPFNPVSLVEDILQQRGGLFDNKLVSRRDEEASVRRNEATEWMRKTLGVVAGRDLPAEPSEEDFRLALRTGIILCNVLNKVVPNAVPKVIQAPKDSSPVVPDGTAPLIFQYAENVKNFIEALGELGIPTFEASDLEKGGNLLRVVSCLLELKCYAEWIQGGKIGSWKLDGLPNSKPPLMKTLLRRNSEPSMMKSMANSLEDKKDAPIAIVNDPKADLSEMNSNYPSLLSLVREHLSNKRTEEIPYVVESLLAKVMNEFEHRLLEQQERLRTIQLGKASSFSKIEEYRLPEQQQRHIRASQQEKAPSWLEQQETLRAIQTDKVSSSKPGPLVSKATPVDQEMEEKIETKEETMEEMMEVEMEEKEEDIDEMEDNGPSLELLRQQERARQQEIIQQQGLLRQQERAQQEELIQKERARQQEIIQQQGLLRQQERAQQEELIQKERARQEEILKQQGLLRQQERAEQEELIQKERARQEEILKEQGLLIQQERARQEELLKQQGLLIQQERAQQEEIIQKERARQEEILRQQGLLRQQERAQQEEIIHQERARQEEILQKERARQEELIREQERIREEERFQREELIRQQQIGQEEIIRQQRASQEEISRQQEIIRQQQEERARQEERIRQQEIIRQQEKARQQGIVQQQNRNLQELKTIVHQTKSGVLVMHKKYQEEYLVLCKHVRSLVSAASGYQKVLEENRKLYNQVQDLKGNIRVYCRVRPFLGAPSPTNCVGAIDDGSISIITPSNYGKDGRKTFNFNKCFGPTATQTQVFADTQPLIRSVLDGYNVCIFAYGQTGSGKTFTMSGPDDLTEDTMGVNYRALNDLFQIQEQRKDTIIYEIGVQMLEIYNEQVRDLLSTDGATKKLEIRNKSTNGINVPEANLVPVATTTDVINLMNLGNKNRAVGSTAMNSRSSRSHSCLTVHVQGKYVTSPKTIHASLHLVDLAGSERADKTEATGDRLKEAQYINKSLSALGDVIASLAAKSTHVPYRNSKLTQLLQDSLGGQAKTLMFVHMSPEPDAVGETLSTLKFAERVATVELGAAKANDNKANNSGAGGGSADVKDLKDQIASLKAALARKDAELENYEAGKINKSHGSSPALRNLGSTGGARKLPRDDSTNLEGQNQNESKVKRRSLDYTDMDEDNWVDESNSNKMLMAMKRNDSLTSNDSLVAQWEADNKQYSPSSSPTSYNDYDELEMATNDSSEASEMNWQPQQAAKPASTPSSGLKPKKPTTTTAVKSTKAPETRSPASAAPAAAAKKPAAAASTAKKVAGTDVKKRVGGK